MARGRKKLTLDEKIRETQQSIYNLENRTQELYGELEELLELKKREQLELLSDALTQAGVTVEEVLASLQPAAGREEENMRQEEMQEDLQAHIA